MRVAAPSGNPRTEQIAAISGRGSEEFPKRRPEPKSGRHTPMMPGVGGQHVAGPVREE
jgi:hypothetical protein